MDRHIVKSTFISEDFAERKQLLNQRLARAMRRTLENGTEAPAASHTELKENAL